jgi:hypothetical protein
MSPRTLFFWILVLCTTILPAHAEFDFRFEEAARRWTLVNSQLEATFRLTAGGQFEFVALTPRDAGRTWRAPWSGASPVRFQVDGQWWDHRRSYRLSSQGTRAVSRGGYQQTIVLADSNGEGEVTLELQMWEKLPVLRYAVRFRNTLSRAVTVTGADMAAWDWDVGGRSFEALRVEQWHADSGDPATFKPLAFPLSGDGVDRVLADSGAHGRHCAWLALRSGDGHGFTLGLEFDGRARTSIAHSESQQRLRLQSQVVDLAERLEPGEEMEVPRAFLAFFQGDWDQAAYATHRFVEAALARQVPAGVEFPFVSWDSWGYGREINEELLRRNADAAARLGVELFVVDLGWARQIGDWYEDPAKFPRGLRAVSDYVHSLGMKFGLHLAWAEADEEAPVLEQNQDWANSEDYGYWGARSLCVAHRPAREWIVSELTRVIDDYGVDWILQDGENMVKVCRKTSHTHAPNNSNYAGANALDWVLREMQRRRPGVMWENCENGGNLMTYRMVQNYVTSIVNDASGALGSRQAAWGASYPFPPRYMDRYMPEQELDAYTTRSYLFGGPWIFMNRLADLRPADAEFAAREIDLFKRLRPLIRNGKVLHLSGPPGEGRIDAIGSYDAGSDRGVAVITRDQASADRYRLRMPDFAVERSYRIRFADDTRTLTLTGAQLRDEGVDVPLPELKSSEVVQIEPLK